MTSRESIFRSGSLPTDPPSNGKAFAIQMLVSLNAMSSMLSLDAIDVNKTIENTVNGSTVRREQRVCTVSKHILCIAYCRH